MRIRAYLGALQTHANAYMQNTRVPWGSELLSEWAAGYVTGTGRLIICEWAPSCPAMLKHFEPTIEINKIPSRDTARGNVSPPFD